MKDAIEFEVGTEEDRGIFLPFIAEASGRG